jgi:hypothetical protein
MKKIFTVFFSLLFFICPIIEINAQILKRLKDKQSKIGNKVAGKMLNKIPGGKIVENSANDQREYEDLNYHYKYQNDSLLFFLTFNHKLGMKGDVVLSIRNISEKEIILDNIDHKKDKKGIYDKTFNSLRKIGLNEMNLLNEENTSQFLINKKDVMDEYYENMKGVFKERIAYFKGEILSNKQKMFNSLKPTDEFIKRNSPYLSIETAGGTSNFNSFNPQNFNINLSSKNTGANVFDSNQVNIEYTIKTFDFRNYFDFTSKEIISNSKVLSSNQTKSVDLTKRIFKDGGFVEIPNPDVFQIKRSPISDFGYYLKYIVGGEKTKATVGQYKATSNNTFPDYTFNFPETITIKLREHTSITFEKNPDWNETWRMEDDNFASEKFKFTQQKRVDRKKDKKRKKKKN